MKELSLPLDRLDRLQGPMGSVNGLAPLLERWSAFLVDTFEAAGGSVMVFDGEGLQLCAHCGSLPREAYDHKRAQNKGIADHVLETGQPLLIEDIERSAFASQAHGQPEAGKSLMSVPLCRDGTVTGVMNVRSRVAQTFTSDELQTLAWLSVVLVRDMQVVQMRGALRSHYATASLQRAHGADYDAMVRATENPGTLARLLARSFYRELRRMGFASTQIIGAATEIIATLGDSLRASQKKGKEGGGG